MKAIDLYNQLEKDFVFDYLSDEWAKYMTELSDLLTDSFKARSMGLVCDFAVEINKVYSAVFPTEGVLKRIIDKGETDAMLFLHHPSIWDIRREKPFYQMNRELLEKLKENRVSLYNLHVPLDNFGEYSTSNTLAETLDLVVEKPFASYRGGQCGVIGTTECKTLEELKERLSKALGHEAHLYLYGKSHIENGRVAIVAGGGNNTDTVSEMLDNNVKVLISGITVNNEAYSQVHKLEQENGISVLGGTHYSTEKFACIKMCTYFEKLGVPSTFIKGTPIKEDM